MREDTSRYLKNAEKTLGDSARHFKTMQDTLSDCKKLQDAKKQYREIFVTVGHD
jgi:hypothetical protein